VAVLPTPKSNLDRAAILDAFQKMSDELGRHGTTGEPCLFGGAVMVLQVKGLFEEGKI